MVDKNRSSPSGSNHRDRSERLLEDPLPPKGRVKLAVSNYKIARQESENIPQAVIKITSYLSTVDHTRTHHYYISRNGVIELEDELGNLVRGRDEIQDRVDEWRVDFTRESNIDAGHFKITIHNTDPKKCDDLLKQARLHADQYLANFPVRIDKGRYKKDENTIYITVKQTDKDHDLPALEDIQERFQSLFNDFDVKVDNTKKYKNRDIVNIMFSSPEHTSPEKVRAAVRNTVKQLFGSKGYRYVFALHEDTANPHVHVSIKLFNEKTGKRLAINPKDLHQMRQLYVEKSQAQGIKLAASFAYQRGKRKENLSIREVRLAEHEQKAGRKLIKTEKLIANIKHDLKQRKHSPLKQAMFDYKQQFNTQQQFIDEAARLKQRSFNEVNHAKKRALIMLYKALEKEADRLSVDKISQLNETVRAGYLDDAQVLARVAARATTDKEQQQFKEMANTLHDYAQAMPTALSKHDQLLNELETHQTKQTKLEKNQDKSDSLEYD